MAGTVALQAGWDPDQKRGAVVEAHPSWTGPCECVKPLLYRISLDKEEIKFCTAPSDKVPPASLAPIWQLCFRFSHLKS